MVASNYEGLQLLYKFHYQKEKNVFQSLCKTFKTVAWVAYVFAYQKVAKNVESVGRNEYDVHYVLGNSLYKVRVRTRRGPPNKKVLQVIDENDNDATAAIVPYLGPLEDWHGGVYTPSSLSFESLTFNLSNGMSATYQKDDPLVLFPEAVGTPPKRCMCIPS
jgi:hypothetical protein